MNTADYEADDWLDLAWSPWRSLDPAAGVYRIWDLSEPHSLVYIGQSTRLRNRLYRLRRTRIEELHFSYFTHPAADAKQKLEQIETDLIGAHWLALDMAPRDQFYGGRGCKRSCWIIRPVQRLNQQPIRIGIICWLSTPMKSLRPT